jgi:hypothetical protein
MQVPAGPPPDIFTERLGQTQEFDFGSSFSAAWWEELCVRRPPAFGRELARLDCWPGPMPGERPTPFCHCIVGSVRGMTLYKT